jgi:hypothetical protein
VTDAQWTADYWGSLFDHTATVIRRAQQRGQATTDIDPIHAIESLLAPIYLRTLTTHQPVDATLVAATAAATARMLHPTAKTSGRAS